MIPCLTGTLKFHEMNKLREIPTIAIDWLPPVFFSIGKFLLLVAVFWAAGCVPRPPVPDPPLVVGLDHISVAVTDLETAAEQYRALGFTIKSGRFHENGIRNFHIKFSDGTEIELITVSETRDPLSAEYLQILSLGEGAVFAGFFAPDLDRLAGRFEETGKNHRWENGLLAFPEADKLRYLFFGNRFPSPTDQPTHFEHANGAYALIGVWIAGDDLVEERQLLTGLGASISEQPVWIPDRSLAPVARFPQAEIRLLPVSRQLIPGRRIVGATLRTNDLDPLRILLAASSLEIPPIIQTKHGRRLILPPDLTRGIWLEFREVIDE